MPEGPSIVLLREEVQSFTGRTVVAVEGNAKLDIQRMRNKKILALKSWGKHFLICFSGFTLRVHFLLFGSYRLNERKDAAVRLSLGFKKGEINLYSCSLQYLEGDIDEHYDWSTDVMNDDWDPKQARKKLKAVGDEQICDALLDQTIFSGVGNIIKNEILYLARVHPESTVASIPSAKLTKLILEARDYSFKFLDWKREFTLKQHWLAHTKKMCTRCKLPIIKKYTGFRKRRSFFCNHCQLEYT